MQGEQDLRLCIRRAGRGHATATTVTKVTRSPCRQSTSLMSRLCVLLAGRRVVFSDLGSFSISVRSKCFSENVMKADEFSPSEKFKGYHINFRPEMALKKAIAQKISFKRVAEATA